MQTIKASEFKAKCLHLMDEVNRTGEEIAITKNGKPVNALQTINRALASGQLGVASISFWEIAMLVRKKRLDIQIELDNEGRSFRTFLTPLDPTIRLVTLLPSDLIANIPIVFCCCHTS
jgi:prevent-host-death family protein